MNKLATVAVEIIRSNVELVEKKLHFYLFKGSESAILSQNPHLTLCVSR